MGLVIHDLGNVPHKAADRDYFIYLLDYGWKEPLAQAMYDNFDNLTQLSDKHRLVVVRGTDSRHFADQVFSWHKINGENADELLPAVMVTTLPPTYFQNERNDAVTDDVLLLIPLKRTCETTQDVIGLMKGLFEYISTGLGLSNFRIVREMNKGPLSRIYNALILEPNFSGVGVDIKKLFRKDV